MRAHCKPCIWGFPIANAAQHKRPAAGACPALLLRRPGQAGSETGSSVGIAETTYLGFLEDKESHIEVSRLCNQYKYALPTSEIARKLQDEARGHCLCQSTSVLVRSSPCSVLCRQEFVVLCKPQYRHFGAANVLFRQGILQSLPQARVSS